MRKGLIGFGLGLAIGAAVLQLMTAAQSAGGESLSREELQKQAETMGLTIADPNSPNGKTYTQKELDAAVASAKEAAERASEQAAGGQAKPQSEADEQKQEGQPAETAGQQTRTFYVWVDASLQEVANGLQSLGLIKDKNEFIQYAKPYSSKIRVGPCTFAGQPTYDEIIAELTRGKK